MRKSTLVIGFLSLLVLSACQNAPSESAKNSAPDELDQKAVSTSKVSITVAGEELESPAATLSVVSPTPTVTPEVSAKELIISEDGLSPATLIAGQGETLKIFNSLDKQVDLYTTAGGADPCLALDATIEIPGLETREIVLSKAAVCDIINQLNTDQKTTLTVE